MKEIRLITQVVFFFIFLIVVAKGNMFLWLGLFILCLLGATLFGRFYCGYICPMNTMMRVTEKVSIKLNLRTQKIPQFLMSKWFFWALLLLMIVFIIISQNVLHREIPVLIILLALSIVVTLRYEAWFFHNHICPYGALLKLTGKCAKYSTQVDESECIGCKKCEKVCLSNAIKLGEKNKVAKIDKTLCHQCQDCTYVCPKNAIHYEQYLK